MCRKNRKTRVRGVLISVILAAASYGCGGGSSASSNPPPPTPNPIPAITSISPSSATAGGAAFTLTVNGSNFISSSTVQWNGSIRTTTFSSSTVLTAQISASDIAAGGNVPITVVNPAPGGGSSNSSTFTINNPTPAIGGLSPATTVVGGPAFTLTVNGSNFLSSSVVQWNGSNRPTAFASSNQVTAQIPASDIAAGGKAAITVFTLAPGGGSSNSSTFTVLFLPRFAYVVDINSGTISSLTVNATTGQLRHNGYALAGESPTALAIDPFGKFAYAGEEVSGDIFMYSISTKDGTLTSIGPPLAAGIGGVGVGSFSPISMMVDPSGRFLYVTSPSNKVSTFTINATTGNLAPSGMVSTGSDPFSAAIDASGRFLYVGNELDNKR